MSALPTTKSPMNKNPSPRGKKAVRFYDDEKEVDASKTDEKKTKAREDSLPHEQKCDEKEDTTKPKDGEMPLNSAMIQQPAMPQPSTSTMHFSTLPQWLAREPLDLQGDDEVPAYMDEVLVTNLNADMDVDLIMSVLRPYGAARATPPLPMLTGGGPNGPRFTVVKFPSVHAVTRLLMRKKGMRLNGRWISLRRLAWPLEQIL